MKPKLGLGLIGWGRIVRLVYRNVLDRIPGIVVTAVAEPDEASRQHAATCFPRAQSMAEFPRLLDARDVDAVLIAAPTHVHARIAVSAFEAGKHVYLEKPLAADLHEAARVIDAWKASGTVGMMGFNFRHDVRYQELRRRMATGEIGRIVAVRTVFTTGRREIPAWKRSRTAGGGALLELASHDFDLVRYVCGREIAAVNAQLRSMEHEDDWARVSLRLDDGLSVECLASTCAVDEARFEVYGDAGKLAVDRFRAASVKWQAASHRYSGADALWTGLRDMVDGLPRLAALRGRGPLHSYRTALCAFASAVHNGASCTPDLHDGYRSLAIVAAAESSANACRWVAPPETGDEDPVGG